MRPPAELVRSDEAAASAPVAAPSKEPDIGHTAMIGAAIGFVVALATVTISGTVAGLGLTVSIGLGAFVGLWGGAGFGFMMGATIPFARYLDAQHSADHRGDPR